MQHRSDAQLEAALDRAQYDQHDLISIRIPLNMPYLPQNTDFERVDGEITLQGTIYKYVKRKIDRGELVLLCLPDPEKMQLESGKDQFFQLASEFQQFKPSRHGPIKITSIFKLSIFDVPRLGICISSPSPTRRAASPRKKGLSPMPFIGALEPPPDGTVIFCS